MQYNTGLTLIGYFGTIIGGVLTLCGVLLTLKIQEKDRVENLSIQYRPMIKISEFNSKIVTENNAHKLKCTIKNIGRGKACKVKVIFSENVEIIDSNCKESNIYEINLFPVEQEMELEFRYFKILEGKNVIEEDRIINFEIIYMDLYSVFTYKSKIDIEIHPITWPHTIANVYGDINFEKN